MDNETKPVPGAPVEEPRGGNTPLKRVIGPRLLLFFVVGDILGTTVYSLTGQVAGRVGGALWVPFLVAFAVAFLTAFSYLELVGKYPRAAGAALYVHKAFGVHFLTFMVAFAVMCSGITSASSAAQGFSGDYLKAIVGPDVPSWIVAIGFLLLLAGINLRGVSESVRVNAVLTTIEVAGLLIVILFGAIALFGGPMSGDVDPDPGRLLEFNPDNGPFLAVTSATALAFFAMVGFEDSVNMAEETKDPVRTFPRVVLLGLCITAAIYLLIAVITSSLVPTGLLADSDGPLLLVVQAAAPWFPPVLFSLIAMFALTNTALINMLMASRLLYGMANERIIPRAFGRVLALRRTPWVSILFTSAIAVILVSSVSIAELGGTTSLLLLMVFAVVNVAVLVLRKDKVAHPHFTAPTWVPVLGVLTCVFFALPITGRPLQEYVIAGALLAVGVLFWLLNHLLHRGTDFDPAALRK
ncbi:APC family permease [Marinactinospora thermotolerans]|uniref:Amino acid/polyamine/organocation transporter, APC superfamily n=1 Tax=Marinactinospora thermotolerans DSM 45154 TaxID=1122192 RepID=A0A1T4SZT4_9ACTN|nr:APC family permease [Marinactinospora thermotolerans]SKA33687.1 amino acid/polyamine/organocation transporter, APC superfamily [Marinactinospora thermotolerans DSM 45154]